MRLSTNQIETIRNTIRNELGATAEVVLFGSRVDDSAKGGDIDLMITLPGTVERPSVKAAHLAALLERKMDERRVDIVLVTPKTIGQPIHRVARQYGIRL